MCPPRLHFESNKKSTEQWDEIQSILILSTNGQKDLCFVCKGSLLGCVEVFLFLLSGACRSVEKPPQLTLSSALHRPTTTLSNNPLAILFDSDKSLAQKMSGGGGNGQAVVRDATSLLVDWVQRSIETAVTQATKKGGAWLCGDGRRRISVQRNRWSI